MDLSHRIAPTKAAHHVSRGTQQLKNLFGSEGSLRYDREAVRMSQRYKSAHHVQNEIILWCLRGSIADAPTVVDLGCGTASDGLYILSKSSHAQYLGIDCSPAMLSIARRKMELRGLGNRSRFLETDLWEMNPVELASVLRTFPSRATIDCVMSSLVLHHYALDDKQLIYSFVHNLLDSGGMFVVTDLFTNESNLCAEYALERELSDVRVAQLKLDGEKGESDLYPTTLSERHYRDVNRPQLLSTEIESMKSVGFSMVDVVFRYGQLGVIVGMR